MEKEIKIFLTFGEWNKYKVIVYLDFSETCLLIRRTCVWE